jgi:hypothetical protein
MPPKAYSSVCILSLVDWSVNVKARSMDNRALRNRDIFYGQLGNLLNRRVRFRIFGICFFHEKLLRDFFRELL